MNKLASLKAIVKPALSAIKAPYGIAVLASVGVHGLLFTFGPSSQMSFASFGDTNSIEAERTVPLIQLSPDEQGRLPNFSQPQFPDPFVNSFDNSAVRLLPIPSALPPITRTPAPSALGQITQPAIPPRAAAPQLIPRSGTSFTSPYTPGPLTLPILPVPTQSPGAAPSTPQRNTMRGATALRGTTQPEQPSEDTLLQRALEVEAQDAANQAAERARAEAAKIAASFGHLEASGETAGAETPDEIADTETLNVETPDTENSGDGNIAIAPSDAQPSKFEQLRASLEFNSTDVSVEEAEVNRSEWLAQAQTETGDIELQVAEPVTVPMDANFRLCVDNPPTNGLIGVVVTPEGTPANDPVILQSTGYAYLNQTAIGIIRNTPFEPTDHPIAYQFDIDVSYDAENCVERSQILQTAEE